HADGTLRNTRTGKCLDIPGAATAAGTGLQIWDCTAGPGQIWTPQADGTLKNPNSGRCADAAAGLNPIVGRQILLADCTGALPQQWTHYLTDSDGLQGFLREQDTLDTGTLVTAAIHEPTVTQTARRSAPSTGGQDWTAHMAVESVSKTRTRIAATNTWRWTQAATTYD